MKVTLLSIVHVVAAIQLCAQSFPVIIEAESGTLGTDYETIEADGVTYITPKTNFVEGVTTRPS